MNAGTLTRTNGNGLVQAGGYIPSYDLAGIQSASKILFESGMFTDVRSAAQACVKVMAGAELGIPPFASMQGIHIIKGKPCLSAGIMAGKVKGSGKYDFRVTENSDKAVEIVFFQNGDKIGESRFTLEDARRAETQNLGKFPRNMLYARAMSNGVKWHCPDIFLGPVYVPEEMGASVNEDGEVIQSGMVDSFGEYIPPVHDTIPPPRTQVQPRRNSDPQEYREERVDGQRIHQKQADPATGSTAPIMRGEENEHFQPRTTDADAANAAALKKGIGTHKGWMVNKKLARTGEAENRALSLWLLNRARDAVYGTRDDLEPWTSRKDLDTQDWTECNNALAKLTHPELTQWVQAFYAAIKAEEAGAEEDPFAGDDPALDPAYCFACGSRESCECSNELKIKAYASMKAAEAQAGALLEVAPVASGGRGFGSD